MRQSQLFSKTRKNAPRDEVARNAILLIRAGFIHKEMAGVYSCLPLGWRVMERIRDIIRQEMNALGGQEVNLTTLQEREIWEKTGRWDDKSMDIWFKTKLKSGTELGLASTHEEPLTRLLKDHVSSYRDLPLYIYQFQTKFRNELRAKSGIMRGREFMMKDLYSFSRTQEEHHNFYELAKKAYMRIFEKAGISDLTYSTLASGGTFSKFSDEFQTITDAGEDSIFITNEGKKEAVNKEIESPVGITEKRAIEVGNIFSLGTRFSESLGLHFLDENGEKRPVIMGSYGIGLGRLMGVVAEVLSDESGLVWPEAIAPADFHLIEILADSQQVRRRAEHIVSELEKESHLVLYDDRNCRAGEKFADADLIGIPYQIIVSERGEAEQIIEIKERKSGRTHIVREADLLTGQHKKFFN